MYFISCILLFLFHVFYYNDFNNYEIERFLEKQRYAKKNNENNTENYKKVIKRLSQILSSNKTFETIVNKYADVISQSDKDFLSS